MPYDEGGFDPMNAVGAAIACILLIAAVVAFVLDDAPRETQEPERNATLILDCSNAADMHRHGLPTKADVMEWHMTGQWGFKVGDMGYIYADLPGLQTTWDELYGIDPDNPAFDK